MGEAEPHGSGTCLPQGHPGTPGLLTEKLRPFSDSMSALPSEKENPGDRFLKEDAAMKARSSTMTDVEAVGSSFTSSSRTGRRNALPDIRSSAAPGGALELPLQLQSLSVKEDAQQKNEETAQDQLENPKEEEK
ncbi:PREDICTED: cAMP-dependent protein kinase inhibitor beta isoform X2 [Chinchilla lanigera]|uniref:cAMP-dependent protein kinase inhibitor beta isoform X2 n=1 Tax=Chinchilla lanigera TaxID=34839 RepID=UPI00038EC594|nr:PREDICTED: cAMP-dependent protein kinase inhibitor beta isoform X2 [Chinchilla lanigera]